MKWREEKEREYWSVPYLPIDPLDIGRQYEGDIIRINSQSGKGGIGYLLQQKYGIDLPQKMREHLGYAVKNVSDRFNKEISTEEIYNIFKQQYVNIKTPIEFIKYSYTQSDDHTTYVNVKLN